MKYLEALLQKEKKNSRDSLGKEPTKPTKPVLSVLSVGSHRNTGGKISPFLPPLSALGGEIFQEHPATTIRPTSEPRPFYDDAREDESEAVTWLRSRLATPQHIAALFSEWCADVVGHPSHEISARMDLLNDARTSLDVEAFIGEDGKFWWRLPVLPGPASWPCPYCGQPATIEDVDRSLDGERTLTFWSCESCQVVAVTPDAIRLPPSGWVKRTEQ